jgi:hypothetical protein
MRTSTLGVASVLVALVQGCSSSSEAITESDADGGGGFGATAAGGATAKGDAATGGSSGATGGAPGTGGRLGSGGATASPDAAADADAAPPHIVGTCDSLGTPGAWQNITPAALHSENWCGPGPTCPTGSTQTYGAHGLAADPTTSGKLWLGTGGLGFWKTSDCGASWVKIDTGAHHEDIDGGRNWSIAVDPTNPQIVWTVSGYGASGIWKSTNGGVDFENMVTDTIRSRIPYGGFIEKITLGPQDPSHVVVSFHGGCVGTDGGEWPCLAVSKDAGASWSLVSSPYYPGEGDGQTMIDENIWYFGNGGGIWRTTNAGGSWSFLWNMGTSGSVFTASDGTFYVGQSNTMAHSVDGIAWTVLANSHGGGTINGNSKIVQVGARIYTSINQYGGTTPPTGLYYSFPLSDPTQWEPAFQPEPAIGGGAAVLIYDPDHKLIYSANMSSGLFRVVVP